jgi:hypothetical protein
MLSDICALLTLIIRQMWVARTWYTLLHQDGGTLNSKKKPRVRGEA